jgi:23S rRNA pseudouridine1911/1915/1917 synthase
MPENLPGFQSRARRPPPEPEAIDVRILYEDDSLIAIDKAPGMVVHPTYLNWSGTLLNAVLWHVRGRPNASPTIITRLDKDTSGVVLVALRPAVHAQVQRSAGAGMRKEYLAVVRGAPASLRGSIELPLARSTEDRRRVVVMPAGQHSVTRYDVLSASNGLALLRCELLTGRTHQIRVHLAASGCPVVGDRVYGTPDEVVARQALHAWRLTLTHPVSGARLEIEAPIPSDLERLLLDQSLMCPTIRPQPV